jgi:arginase
MAYGQPLAGTETAPAALRAAGLLDSARSLGWEVHDAGDVDIPPPLEPSSPSPPSSTLMRNAAAVGEGTHRIARAAYAAAARGDFLLTLGGDHSVALGSVAGLLRSRPSLRVLWVDAHSDIDVPSSSSTGNVHGMPVGFLARLADPALVPGYEWLTSFGPALPLRHLAYVALRDLDPPERRLIRERNIRAYTMQDVDKHGIGKVMEMALDYLLGGGGGGDGGGGSGTAPLHLSFDIDAVDPAVAPSTGTAVPGGLSYRESHYICEACAETGLLNSMDLVEVNPLIAAPGGGGGGAGGEATVDVAVKLVGSALGRTILPRVN